jgi:hypothetical protein
MMRIVTRYRRATEGRPYGVQGKGGHFMQTRKSLRLPDYAYNQNGAYFVTICTKDKQYLF